jgi:hypothetical protein
VAIDAFDGDLDAAEWQAAFESEDPQQLNRCVTVTVEDNGLTAAQSELIQDIYLLEGRMQHAYCDVNAPELRDRVLALRDSLPTLVSDTVDWLSRHGIVFKG